MFTSVMKQVFDRDVLCEFGFSSVSSNRFSFPISGNGVDLTSGIIDGAALLGHTVPLAQVKTRDMIATQNIALRNGALADRFHAYLSGGYGYTVTDYLTVWFTATFIDATFWDGTFSGGGYTRNYANLLTFYNMYTATKAKVDAYPANLNLLPMWAITQLINLASPNTISVAQWGYLHGLNQSLATSASDVYFAKLTLTGAGLFTTGITVGTDMWTPGQLAILNGTSYASIICGGDVWEGGPGGSGLYIEHSIEAIENITANKDLKYVQMLKPQGNIQTIGIADIKTDGALKYIELSGASDTIVLSYELLVLVPYIINGIKASTDFKIGQMIKMYADDTYDPKRKTYYVRIVAGTSNSNTKCFHLPGPATEQFLGFSHVRMAIFIFTGDIWRSVGDTWGALD